LTAAAHRLRAVLVAEIVLFSLASLIHRGILARGFEHTKAAIAEGIIALVLAIGLAITVYSPNEGRAAAVWTQGFALLGVCVGVVMIMIGVGPRTGLDYWDSRRDGGDAARRVGNRQAPSLQGPQVRPFDTVNRRCRAVPSPPNNHNPRGDLPCPSQNAPSPSC